MFGLALLGAAAVYLFLLAGATLWGWWIGRRLSDSAFIPAVFATAGFMLVFLPLFWDAIPTAVLHRHHCAADAGFTAYVDPGGWYKQNRSVVDQFMQLPRNTREAVQPKTVLPDGFSRYFSLNGLIASDMKIEEIGRFGARISRTTFRIVDATRGTAMATAVDYRSGHGDLRAWLNAATCYERPPQDVNAPVLPVTPRDFIFQYEYRLRGTGDA